MQNEQPINPVSTLIDSLEHALASADRLGLIDVAIYINQALVALGIDTHDVSRSGAA